MFCVAATLLQLVIYENEVAKIKALLKKENTKIPT
jgi:hypothetical protein